MKRLIFLIPMLFLVFMNCKSNQPEVPVKEQSWGSAQEINSRLGRGINIGNTFEAMQTWQSPFVAGDLKRIAELGFTHVRIPIRWERDDRSMTSTPYKIQPLFMKTIKSVVDEALKNKLHIIINMHHHEALMSNPDNEKGCFLSQWE